ncbi:MAG: ABC transporter ATP-binding protein [Desulfurococcaceae archaeon]
MGTAVKIVGFTKKFGNFTAVDNLNLEIEEGELFGLLGPNGSGKTTTLLTISTVYKPTSGDIEVFGHSVVKEDYEVRKLVGIAFQEPKAMWIDKPWDLLLWHARVVGYSGSEARKVVEEVMRELELWEHRNKYFYQLSGGTRKKVEIAKVLIQRPRLAIFDEPTAQVDVNTKHKLWDVIKAMRDEGSTILIATNDMFEAERICERIAIMYKGRLRALGSVEELKDMIPSGDVIDLELEGPGNAIERVVEALSNLGKVIRGNGTRVRIFLERAEEKVIEVVDIVRGAGVRPRRVQLKEPTLDDVFMYFTGASLREE